MELVKNSMPLSWMVTVDGQAYGPYALEQIRTFITEGRLVAQSLIAAPGENAHPAGTDPVFVEFFRQAKPPEIIAGKPKADAPAQSFGRYREPQASAPCHFVIMAEMKMRSVDALEQAIVSLGQTAPLVPNAWLLTTTQNFNTVRNTLVPKLGQPDAIFIVDTTHDRASWLNFGPEPESRIRRVWDRAAPAKTA